MKEKNEYIKIIEIEGVKIEVDLRTAKRVDLFKVGDRIKVLKKSDAYGNKGWTVAPGVIIGFDLFKSLPTISIAYLSESYPSWELKFLYLNEETKDVEISAAEDEYLPLKKEDVVWRMESEIAKKRHELEDAEAKLAWFQKHFATYFKLPAQDEIA